MSETGAQEGSTERRVALVTGAASGIGLATARLLSERGYSVMATDLALDRLRPALADRPGIRLLEQPLGDPVLLVGRQRREFRDGGVQCAGHSAYYTHPGPTRPNNRLHRRAPERCR